jgi:chromosome segregation ATPase
MKSLESEHKLVEQEIESLQHEKSRYEDSFASCVLEKYKVANDLELCEQREVALTQQVQEARHDDVAGAVDLDQELARHDYDLKSFLQLDVNPRTYSETEGAPLQIEGQLGQSVAGTDVPCLDIVWSQ